MSVPPTGTDTGMENTQLPERMRRLRVAVLSMPSAPASLMAQPSASRMSLWVLLVLSGSSVIWVVPAEFG